MQDSNSHQCSGLVSFDSSARIRPYFPHQARFSGQRRPQTITERSVDKARRGASIPEMLVHVLTRSVQDVRYLKPHVVEVAKEDAERQAWDHIVVAKK